MGQALVTTQFYFYGKKHFTRTGWLSASAKYDPSLAVWQERVDLAGKVFLVTGANSGIGRQLAEFLASKKGTIYMVCRNQQRGEAAVQEIIQKTSNERVHLLLGDMGVLDDIQKVAKEVQDRETALDGLVCNAGALLNKRQLTREGIEVTFATHLLFGSYGLSKQLMPLLERASDPRVVMVSSGGMYNVAYKHDLATGTRGSYDGQLAYAYAKRGQVLLCERWASMYPKIKFVSCHPGWVDTPGVDSAYGSNKSFLQPMRDLWEGSEGICWLCTAPGTSLSNGGFYLDRFPQPTILPGRFMSGTVTRKSDVDAMMNGLESMVAEVSAKRAMDN